MNANWNWLQNLNGHADEPGRPQAMPVFAGQKLVVVGGSSGWGARPPPTSWPPGAAPSSSAKTPARSTTPSRHWPRTAGLRHHRRPDRPRTGGPGPPATGRRARRRDPADQRGRAFIPQALPGVRRRLLHPYLELDRAIFSLTQTVVRGMVEKAAAASSSTSAVCGATRPRGHAVDWLLGGQGGLRALTHNLAIELAPPHPGQRGRSGRRRRPDLREVRPP